MKKSIVRGNKRRKIFILGSYGCNNRGDEAILSSIINALEDIGDITVANGKFDDMKKYFNVETISCRLSEGKITLKLFVQMFVDSIRQFKVITKSDMLIYGGGSSIHDLTPYNLVYMFFWQLAAQLFKKRVCYISMGVGPIDTKLGKILCRRFLAKADRLYVRDKRGYRICRSLGISNVKLSSDLAFYRNGKAHRKDFDFKYNKDEYITVSACAWFKSTNFWERETMNFEKQIDEFSDCLKVIYEKFGKKLIFVPTFGYDEELGHKLEEKLGIERIYCLPKELSYQNVSDVIGSAWLHVGMRMHSIIFALRACVPCIPFIYDEKVRQLVRRYGMNRLAVDLNEMTEERMAAAACFLEENRDAIVAGISQKSQELHDMSEECLQDIRKLLMK